MRADFLRYFGIGYYHAWQLVAVMRLAGVDPIVLESLGAVTIRMALSGCGAIAMAIAMLVEQRLDILSRGKWIVSLAGCVMAMGTLLLTLLLPVSPTLATCVLCAALIAAGSSLVRLSWIDFLMTIESGEQLRHILFAWPFAAGLALVASLVPVPVQVGACVCLPVLSAVTLIMCNGDERNSVVLADEPARLGVSWKSPLTRVLIATVVVAAAYGIARSLPQMTAIMGESPVVWLVVAVVFGAIFVANFRINDKKRLLVQLYRACLPIMTICYLFAPFLAGSTLVLDVALLTFAASAFEMLIWLICPLIVVEHGRLSFYIFGWGAAAFHVGSILGFALAGVFDLPGSESGAGIACAVVAAVMVLLVAYGFREQELADCFMQSSPVEIRALESSEASGTLEDACAAIAREHSLSPRELEVLELLAHGRSVPYIEEALRVSTSTAKTHVRHIYQKLGVHTKQELLDTLAGEGAGSGG